MMATLAIIGIVSTIAGPNVLKIISGNRLSRATTQMVWDLQALRMRAISQKQTIAVEFTTDRVYTIKVNGVTTQTKDIDLAYKDVRLASTNNPEFTSTGTVNNPATITLTSASSTKTISVNTAGLIKIN